jgi:C-terminal processing protease CtpA/Prc
MTLTRASAPVRRLALAAALCLSAAPLTAAQQTLDRIDRERALQMLGTIKGNLKKNYYDPELRGMDVEARFAAAEEKIKNATTLNQAFGIIAQAVLDLNDSHTVFVPPPRPVSVEYGWKMQPVGERVFVSAIKPGSDAEAKGLKVGDEVISVDGFRPSRKELWKMEYYYNLLSPRPGMRFVVRSPGGEPRELDVAAKVRQGKRILNFSGSGSSTIDINDAIREAEDSDRLLRHRFQRLPGAIIWKMPTFGFDPDQVDTLMGDQIKGSSALILDLRGNGGGLVVTLERLVSYFFDREVKLGDLKGRKEMKPQVARKRGGKPYEGKVVVLIDSKSGSASEVFARVMQLEKRGVVLGDRSSGAVMRSRYYGSEMGVNTKLFYGVSITDADLIMADGKSLEYTGVTPDEVIIPTAEDLANRRDPVLARAAAILGMQLDPAKAGAMFPIEWQP